jgi:hypothetical protein
MLHFQLYVVVNAVDIEKAIGKFFKYGLIILALMAGETLSMTLISRRLPVGTTC